MVTLRRSTRSKRPFVEDETLPIDSMDHYDEEKDVVKRDSRRRSPRRSKVTRSPAIELESENEDAKNDDENDSNSSDEESDDSAVEEPAQKRRAAPAKAKKFSTKDSKPTSRSSSKGSSLVALARKCLDPEETVEHSLLAALLHSKDVPALASDVIDKYQTDSEETRFNILNLLLRSVGSTPDGCLVAGETPLDDWSDEAWDEALTQALDKMQEIPLSKVLLHLDPSKNRAFRTVLEDFFYHLVKAALEGPDAIAVDQIDSIKSIMNTIMVLVGIGQPDSRLVATLAIFGMSRSILEATKELKEKVDSSERHLRVAKRNKSQIKAQTLKEEMETWTESSDLLLGIVTERVLSDVFAKRCRDSEPNIRSYCLEKMSEFCMIRPDVLLAGQYLKYFGWFMHDKEPTVRYAAMNGILTPLKAIQENQLVGVDTGGITKVIKKFREQISKLVFDTSVVNQEKATELLLVLLKGGYLDDIDDADVWDRINSRALAAETSPKARKNILYFIMAQCDPFDDDHGDYVDVFTEKRTVDQILALSSWVASNISKGDTPVDQIPFEHADYIIHSLLAMEEHRRLATSWSAILKALDVDDMNENPRMSTVKQRIILRMLVAAAELEALGGSAKTFYSSADLDPDLVQMEERNSQKLGIHSSKHGRRNEVARKEDFSETLSNSLPQLLSKSKGDTHMTRQLTRLPRYFRIEAFNMPNQKKNFHSLVKMLSSLFLELTDPEILFNCAVTLTAFARANHSRASEALLELTNMACSLRDRILELISKKRLLANKLDTAAFCEVENSKNLCLLRLSILSKRCDIADLFGDGSLESSDTAIRRLLNHVAKDLEYELSVRLVKFEKNDDENENDPDPPEPIIPDIWKLAEDQIHQSVADSVIKGLDFLFLAFAWRLKKEIQILNDPGKELEMDDENVMDHILLFMRDHLVQLLLLCLDQELDGDEYEDGTFPEAYSSFLSKIQLHAHRTAGDLGLLLPTWMHNARNPVIAKVADLGENLNLVYGAMKRFSLFMNEKLRAESSLGSPDDAFARSLVLPFARSSLVNMTLRRFQRNAVAVLEYASGDGQAAASVATAFNDAAKELDPLICANHQFITLQEAFADWCATEPQELADMPSEEESEEYEENLKSHQELMNSITAKALRLSSAYGSGHMVARDRKVRDAILQTVREGVMFSFKVAKGQSAGAQLPFLRPMAVYAALLKNDPTARKDIEMILNESEMELRKNHEYSSLTPFDTESIEEFRKAAGLGALPAELLRNPFRSPGTSRGSVSSSSLSPVPEGSEDEEFQSPGNEVDCKDQEDTSRTFKQARDLDDEHSHGSPPTMRLSVAKTHRDSSFALSASIPDVENSHTLRNARASSVGSPLSATPSSLAADSFFSDGDEPQEGRRKLGSFGRKRSIEDGPSRSRPSRRSRANALFALSESTIQHRESPSDDE